jgi:N utilization substance protein B
MQRKLARENAFILIFESICKKDECADEIFEKATNVRGLEVDDYVRNVFFGSCEQDSLIEEKMLPHLKGWKIERISPVSMAILRLGCYEMLFLPDIPTRVTINEAVELAKKFDDEKSYSFVNGVLNSFAKDFAE